MIRLAVSVLRGARTARLVGEGCRRTGEAGTLVRHFASLSLGKSSQRGLVAGEVPQFSLIKLPAVCQTILPTPAVGMLQQARTVTKFSLKTGKRKSVKAVIKRFKRLHWGAWIRTRTGRHKKLWKKSKALRKRLRQHIFVNGQQSMLLDKMVTKFWRRPKYYIDDPYTPYHTRSEFALTRGRTQKY